MKPKNTSANATTTTVAMLQSSAGSRSAPLRRSRPTSPVVQLSISAKPSTTSRPATTASGTRASSDPPKVSTSASASAA